MRDALGDASSSHALYRDALRLLEPEESPDADRNILGAARLKVSFAASLFDAGEGAEALAIAREALPVLRWFREPYLGVCLGNIATYELALEHYGDAERSAREALALSRDLDARLIAVYAVLHLAALTALRPHIATPDMVRAARLLGFADAALTSREVFRWPGVQREFDRSLAALRGALGSDEVAKLVAEGTQMMEAEAFALAASGPADIATDKLARIEP